MVISVIIQVISSLENVVQGPCTFSGVDLSGINCHAVQFYDADKAKSVLDIYANDKLFKYNNETDNMSLHFMFKIIFFCFTLYDFDIKIPFKKLLFLEILEYPKLK